MTDYAPLPVALAELQKMEPAPSPKFAAVVAANAGKVAEVARALAPAPPTAADLQEMMPEHAHDIRAKPAPGLTPEQQAIRATGIGGSEIAAVAEMSPYAGPLDVYLAKVEGLEIPDNEAMKRGRFLEPGLGAWYADRFGVTLGQLGTIRHPTRPLAVCTPDFLYSTADGLRVLSIKAPGPQTADQWGEPDTDEVPTAYLLQLTWECGILAALGESLSAEHHIAALIFGDLEVYVVRFDPELFEMLLGKAEAFWAKHIAPKVPPPLTGSDSTRDWLARRFPRDTRPCRPATAGEADAMLAFRDAAIALDSIEEVKALWGNRLREAIGDAGGLESPDGRVTWRADKNGKRILKPKFNPRGET